MAQSTSARIDASSTRVGHSSYLVDLGDGRRSSSTRRASRTPPSGAADRGLGSPSRPTRTRTPTTCRAAPSSPHAGREFLAPRGAPTSRSRTAGLDPGDELALTQTLTSVRSRRPVTRPITSRTCSSTTAKPVALFSGGSLMVGTVGRTDLLGPEHARGPRPRACTGRCATRSSPFPTTWPSTRRTAPAPSAPRPARRTARRPSGANAPTNPLFASRRRGLVRRAAARGFGTFPTYFRRLPEINRRGPRSTASLPALARLDRRGRAHADRQAMRVVVDVRPIADFAAGHIPGSLSIELRPVFSSWLGWLVEPDRPHLRPRRRAGPRRARPAVPRRRLREARRRDRRRHRRLARRRTARRNDRTRRAPRDSTGTLDRRSADGTSTQPATSPARVNIELGALRDADVPAGPSR